MSYCRWSSDGFRCDLYCYEHVGGYWAIHVAGRRHKYRQPSPFIVGLSPNVILNPAYLNKHEWWPDADEDEKYERIGLPYDGQSFTCATLGEFRDTIQMLLDLGYNGVPGLLAEIDEEIAELGRDYELEPY